MADEALIRATRDGLMQPERGLYIAPVRHHSPACAWAVRELIREVRPRHVLIEAPADFDGHIPLLLHAGTKPPVAVAALVEHEGDQRVAAYYPLCAHAPEWVAMHEANAIGAKISFIDMPAGQKLRMRGREPDEPVVLSDDQRFDSSDYLNALSHRAGCRDTFELWDHLFEARLGDADWRGFLSDVGAYCAGIRAATTDDAIARQGDMAREAHMASAMLAALKQEGPVVTVVGGFHAPALIAAAASGMAPKIPGADEAGKARSYLIRYSFAAMDALNGYGAGLPQPAYYDLLWRQANEANGAPAWRETALNLTSGFVARSRKQGHPIGLPQQVEMLRVAETLGQMRGRPGALRHDLFDGARAALVKGEAAVREVWSERLTEFLRGDAIGDVPASAGSPPLVEDARALSRAHRFDISDGARRRRKLDIRRKASQLAASRFLHALEMLGAGFAQREVGPDYLNATQTELLFEEWSYAWSPLVEGRLIELAARADTVRGACIALLYAERDRLREAGQARDIAAMSRLFSKGLIAGLGVDLARFLDLLAGDIEAHGDFAAVAYTLRQMYALACARGPLQAPPELDLGAAVRAAYRRLIYLCDDLPSTPQDAVATRVEALRLVAEMLGDQSELDRSLFEAAIDRVVDAGPPPEILGAVLSICVGARRREPDVLCAALAGQFTGSAMDQAGRIGVLRGMLAVSPTLLLGVKEVLQTVDQFVAGMDEAEFMDLLPHLRLAFTALNPREIDQLSELLARRHGGQAAAYQSVSAASEGDLLRGLELDKRLRVSIEVDGLSAWVAGGGT